MDFNQFKRFSLFYQVEASVEVLTSYQGNSCCEDLEKNHKFCVYHFNAKIEKKIIDGTEIENSNNNNKRRDAHTHVIIVDRIFDASALLQQKIFLDLGAKFKTYCFFVE